MSDENQVVEPVAEVTHPIVAAAMEAVAHLQELWEFVGKLPEGTLLHVPDALIFELGEAMLVDGVSTREINLFMLDELEQQLARPAKKISQYTPFVPIPGYDSHGTMASLARSILLG